MCHYASLMTPTQSPAPAPSAASFASLLAALATSAPKSDPEWDDEALAEDVATLSYERALQTHARYHAADSVESAEDSEIQDAIVEDVEEDIPGQPLRRGRTVSPEAFARAQEAAEAELSQRAARRPQTALERNLKSASITIRVSRAEAEQLHHRAAEAGLTVSAYLRSCTFEAETLRAQVKDVLAELRTASSNRAVVPSQSAQAAQTGPWTTFMAWMRRLFIPAARANQRVAQA